MVDGVTSGHDARRRSPFVHNHGAGRPRSVADHDYAGDVVAALKRELTARRGQPPSSDFLRGAPVTSIYIGGGTPSLLRPVLLQSLLDHTASLWDCSGIKEITLEANPEDLTDDYLEALARTDFTRLSIGIQSFDDGLLRLMNRRHTAARAHQAVRAAQNIGAQSFGKNISIDLIWGIPGMTMAQWEHTLDEALDLGVQHISAYHLTIEPGTPFGKMAAASQGNDSSSAFRPIPESETERQYELLRRKLQEGGFEHYEISNWALPNHRAVHNSAYWDGSPYLGVGPSAHSFDGHRRREWVTPDLEKYLTKGPSYGGETLTDSQLRNERLMTGLRRAEGILASTLTPRQADLANDLIRQGLLTQTAAHTKTQAAKKISIPAEKFLLADYIIGSLFE